MSRPVDFPGRMLWAFGLTLVLVVALSWLVGHVGGDDGFDWELAAVFGTALGTTLLAITTGGLAYLTLREVSATKELADLTRTEQLARERPVVIVHTAVYMDSQVIRQGNVERTDGHISLQVVNAGLGPALRVAIEASYKDPEHQPEMRPAIWPAIMPGGQENFAIQPVRFHTRPPGGVDPDGFTVRGTCLDRSQTEEYDVIVTWRTSHDGAYGAFEATSKGGDGK